MAYLSLQDLELATPAQTLIWLSADDPVATAPNTAVIAEAMSYADNVIDGYLRGRYTLPLPSVPPILSDIGVSLARHWLYSRRPEGETPDTVVRMYKGALEMLAGLRDGAITLGDDVGGDAPLPASFKVSASPRLFGDAELVAY